MCLSLRRLADGVYRILLLLADGEFRTRLQWGERTTDKKCLSWEPPQSSNEMRRDA